MNPKVTIDTEFQSLIPSLSKDEYKQLEVNILADGCREPLSLWDELILDGHNRFAICQEHELDFTVVQIANIENREQAINWIIDNQLGRRNLNPTQIGYLRGKRYEQEKKEHGGDRKSSPQNEDLIGRTADRIANQVGVSRATVERDGAFARSVDKLAELGGDDVRKAILQPEAPALLDTRQKVQALAKRVKDKPKEEAVKIIQQSMTNASQQMQVTTFSHGSMEYYTPPIYVDAAREVMGCIDLDPASCETAQEWIKATQFFTEADNGLEQDWHGRVWLNPPYSKTNGESNQALWSNRLVNEYKQGKVVEAILLVKAALGYNWFEDLWYEWPVCFARERLSFIKSDGSSDGKSKQGTAFLYLGENVNKFKEVFSQFGRVILPEVE